MSKRWTSDLLNTPLAALLLSMLIAVAGCGDGGSTSDDAGGDGDDTSTSANNGGETTQPEPEPEYVMLPETKPAPENPRVAEGVTVKEGFQVELLHETDKDGEGSWVALCKGPDNTLFATAQYRGYSTTEEGKKVNKTRHTLFHIKPAPVGDYEAKTEVIPQPVEINGAQGVCYAYGNLYVMESGRENGLVKVTDSDGDGLYDSKQLLLNIWGGGEHGTHAIVPTPDGKGLYIIAGNMSPLPANVDKSRPVFKLWDEDQTLERNPDGRGHASGVMAPGGWICRVDPDGKNVELICQGFRNAYDMDVHPNGELFAYDADMEWDLGLPWYRPTRVNHAVSGAEFGWRNGSGKWPTYFEDSLPAVVEIGPGSPVGVTFGTGAKFPTKYQAALFVLDWTYGTIYAIHLKPDGATYTGELEPFVVGKPLPVTDVAIADDGAMYFTTGGRRGNSAFYRVSYYGVNDTAKPEVKPLNELAKLRKKLESFHRPSDDSLEGIDVELIWDNLGHSDRFVRFAARVALEHLDPGLYTKRLSDEKDPMTRVQASLALARHRAPDAFKGLLGVKPDSGDTTLQLAWMRALGVAFARMGQPSDEQRQAILASLAKLVPTDNPDVVSEIVRLRVFLNDPTVIQFTLDQMNKPGTPKPPAWYALAAQNDRYGQAINKMVTNPPPTDQLNLAFMLRNIKDGWTIDTRSAYFSWLRRAALGGGGNSYQGYLRRIHAQASETLTPAEKTALGPLAELPKNDETEFPIVAPKGPGRTWTVDQAVKLVEGKLKGRDFDRGVGLFQSTLCSQCHRVGEFGGRIGPDLKSAVNFSLEDLLRATIEPSHEISEQYAMSVVTRKDGNQVIGRILENNDQGVKVQPNALSEDTTTVPRDQIASIEDAPVSTMPAGLINPLSAEELRDLVAYIYSGGNREHEAYKE